MELSEFLFGISKLWNSERHLIVIFENRVLNRSRRTSLQSGSSKTPYEPLDFNPQKIDGQVTDFANTGHLIISTNALIPQVLWRTYQV